MAATAPTGVRAIGGGSRITASPQAVAAAQEFWETVGILPVEVVVPGAAGVTLRCYVEDVARFTAGEEDNDLTEIASWPEVADTDTLPLPSDQDRYDLTELSEVLTEVADGAAGLISSQALTQPIEGVRDIAEYAGLKKVDALLSPSSSLGRAIALSEREPEAQLRAEDAAAIRADWDDVVTAVTAALVWRD